MSNAFSRQMILASNYILLISLFSICLCAPRLGFSTPNTSPEISTGLPALKIKIHAANVSAHSSSGGPKIESAETLSETQRYILADLKALITYQERIDWVTDETAIQSLKPRLLELGCRLESDDLQHVEAIISRRIQREGSVKQRWQTQRRSEERRPELSDFSKALAQERVLLAIQSIQAYRSTCPFWIEAQPHFHGIHRDAHRLQLIFETMGSAQLLIDQSSWTVGGSGQGRLIGVWGFGFNAGIGVGVEIGGASTFPKNAQGERNVKAMWTTGLPILFRGWVDDIRLDTEVALLARVPDGDWGDPLMGYRVSQGVGFSTLRIFGFLPHFMIWTGYESYHGQQRLNVVRIGTRVGVSWGGIRD